MPIETGARGRWGALRVAFCLAALALRTPSAAAKDPGDQDVPSGAVVFFAGDDQSCPPGYRIATETRGRLVVAVASGDTVGKQVGDALQSQEDRTHVHPFVTTVELPYKSLAALNGGNHQGAAAAKYTDGGTSEPSASGLPFIQLLSCVKQ